MSGPSVVTEQFASPRVQDERSWGSTLSDYWALTKPEVNFLILITTGVGFYLACGSDTRHPAIFYCAAALLSIGFLYFGLRFMLQRSRTAARRLLAASVIYLPLLFVLTATFCNRATT